MFRWDYDYVEIGDAPDPGDAGAYAPRGYEYGLTELDDAFDVEWGSSSSVSSGPLSPSFLGAGAGAGRSPVEDDGWEGETLASGSEGEKGDRS